MPASTVQYLRLRMRERRVWVGVLVLVSLGVLASATNRFVPRGAGGRSPQVINVQVASDGRNKVELAFWTRRHGWPFVEAVERAIFLSPNDMPEPERQRLIREAIDSHRLQGFDRVAQAPGLETTELFLVAGLVNGALERLYAIVVFVPLMLVFGFVAILRDRRNFCAHTGRCVRCLYDLAGVESGPCPECGAAR
ncbi:MAG: hypothetical protein ACF8R7_09740 [Phycisphaerales bacterium JB039]